MVDRQRNEPHQDAASVHRIRLRGPCWARWERIDRAEGTAPAEDFRVRLPGDWQALFGKTAGRVKLWRRFGRPTNLAPGQSVQIVVPAAEGLRRVRVNECLERVVTGPVPEKTALPPCVRLDVTAALRQNNTLELWLDFDPWASDTPGGLPEPIVLEIHGTPRDDR